MDGIGGLASEAIENATRNDHAMPNTEEMGKSSVDQSRYSGMLTIPSGKVQAIADNDHAMLDAQETRKPLLEQPWDYRLSIAIPVKVRVTETKYQPNRLSRRMRRIFFVYFDDP
ncbi:hypothetical protein GUJ93_ZPchr0011g28404 [Zizania palustris]|uniref:Uncharacterized protein n=1 Tax=Zizania palustris TaxID=103762 RepID=A0A8J6BM60_ZIZPA|nr:hypothetical protein GUJ93_ZPchr0011g28404 [Zizania palustris]